MRRWLGALLVALLATAGIGASAQAATVYELEGAWAPGTPDVVQTDDAVSARWWFNLNDDAPAPGNEPVDPVVLTVHSHGAVFDSMPATCRTTGVSPASEITDDGATLVCNIGTEDQGSAVTLTTGMRVTARMGEEVSADASIADQSAELEPLTVQNPFVQDIYWETTAGQREGTSSTRDFAFPWTIFHGTDGPAGPDTVTYDLTVTNTVGASTALPADACRPFGAGSAAGHPWSDDTHAAEQTAPFPASCTLTRTSNTQYQLTISGIDYSKTQVPTTDSSGDPLPTDRQAVAAGEIWIRLNTSESTGQITVTSSTPTYTAVDGSTFTDDVSNNESAQAWTSGLHYGGWRGSNNWSDTLRVFPGEDRFVETSLTLSNMASLGPTTSSCLLLDT